MRDEEPRIPPASDRLVAAMRIRAEKDRQFARLVKTKDLAAVIRIVHSDTRFKIGDVVEAGARLIDTTAPRGVQGARPTFVSIDEVEKAMQVLEAAPDPPPPPKRGRFEGLEPMPDAGDTAFAV